MAGLSLNVYVIHTPELTLRKGRLGSMLGYLKEQGEAAGLYWNLVWITEPSARGVEAAAESYAARVVAERTGDADFDRLAVPILPATLSNFEKHREAWRRIALLGPGNVNIVVEDDAIIFPDHQGAAKELVAFLAGGGAGGGAGGVRALAGGNAPWDFVFLGMSPPATPENMAAPFGFLDLPLNESKVLPCKEAYLVSAAGAVMMLAETEKVSFFMRAQMSLALYKRLVGLAPADGAIAVPPAGGVRVGYPVRRVTIEGSKVGIYPSSLHPNNMLILNAEFMKMFEMLRAPDGAGAPALRDVKALYKTISHMNNPDLMHLYGVLLFKAGAADEAAEVLEQAVDEMQKQGGVVSARSDVLNNAINVQEHLQAGELARIAQKPSRYAAA